MGSAPGGVGAELARGGSGTAARAARSPSEREGGAAPAEEGRAEVAVRDRDWGWEAEPGRSTKEPRRPAVGPEVTSGGGGRCARGRGATPGRGGSKSTQSVEN